MIPHRGVVRIRGSAQACLATSACRSVSSRIHRSPPPARASSPFMAYAVTAITTASLFVLRVNNARAAQHYAHCALSLFFARARASGSRAPVNHPHPPRSRSAINEVTHAVATRSLTACPPFGHAGHAGHAGFELAEIASVLSGTTDAYPRAWERSVVRWARSASRSPIRYTRARWSGSASRRARGSCGDVEEWFVSCCCA
jgi:hypothetical protein